MSTKIHPVPADANRPTPHVLGSTLSLQAPGADDEFFGKWRGRRVRRVGVGSFICDHVELEKQEAEHWLLRLLIGYPFVAPISLFIRSSLHILDIATSTGIWATDIAELFPHSHITAIDNSPMQTPYAPENVDFELVDLDSDLPYDPSSFDIIHVRFAHLRVKSYCSLLKDAWTLLKPGGTLLLFDVSHPPITSKGDTPVPALAFVQAYHKSLRKAGMTPFALEEVVEIFPNDEMVGSDMRVPIGHGEGRMGQLGMIHGVNTRAWVQSAEYVMSVYGGYGDAEIAVLGDAFLREVDKGELYTRYHALSIMKRDL